MIVDGRGNILDSDATMIVIPINTMGVPGRGLALQAADRWPELLGRKSQYYWACREKLLSGGSIFFLGSGDELMEGGQQQLWGACTKQDWRRPSRYEWVELCGEALRVQCEREQRIGATSIAIPPLGCGLGKLEWPRVKTLLKASLVYVQGMEIRLHAPGEFA